MTTLSFILLSEELFSRVSYLAASPFFSNELVNSETEPAFCSNFSAPPTPVSECRICVFVHVIGFPLPAAGFFSPRLSVFLSAFSSHNTPFFAL